MRLRLRSDAPAPATPAGPPGADRPSAAAEWTPAPAGDHAALDLREPERETAVARVFEQNHAQMVRLAALLGAADEAEDVVGEAFYALYRRWDRLSSPDAALPYVRAAVVNQVKMRLRHRGVVERSPEQAPGEHRSAEAEVLVREDQREVVLALARLPRRQREAIVLRYWLDLSEADVAQAMGVSCGAVKTHTSRAMAALSRSLGSQP